MQRSVGGEVERIYIDSIRREACARIAAVAGQVLELLLECLVLEVPQRRAGAQRRVVLCRNERRIGARRAIDANVEVADQDAFSGLDAKPRRPATFANLEARLD